jgi:hypothetical protein
VTTRIHVNTQRDVMGGKVGHQTIEICDQCMCHFSEQMDFGKELTVLGSSSILGTVIVTVAGVCLCQHCADGDLIF